jgi:hypothetical protein
MVFASISAHALWVLFYVVVVFVVVRFGLRCSRILPGFASDCNMVQNLAFLQKSDFL